MDIEEVVDVDLDVEMVSAVDSDVMGDVELGDAMEWGSSGC